MDSDSKVNILIVDDRPENIQALDAVLAAPDRNIVPARTGQEALRRLLADEFAVVLMDVRMPVMDGFETVALIRQREKTRHLPIIFVTAFGPDDHEIRKAYSLGAVDFLHKPVVPEILRSKIAAYVGLYRWAGERAARVEAQKANRIKDEFLATLSHELRAPLNAMVGWVGLLRKGPADSEELRRGLEVIDRNTKVQARLISDLLDINRILAGKLRMDFRTVDMPGAVRAAVDSVRPAAAAKGLSLESDVEHGPAPVLGDPDRLQQIVWNLLSNAVKFVHKGGTIRVGLRREETRVRLTISDNGPGIEPKFLAHVFERFRQADGARRHGGLGLGLAIVRHLVEMHGGSVKCECAGLGGGTTFTVVLPLQGAVAGLRPPVQGPGSREGPTESALLDGVRVLLVDDESDACGVAALVLRRCGARVRTAESASEALAALAAEPPDVLLSDIAMPEEDGYGLIRKVRAMEEPAGRRLPAAAMTAYATDEDRLRTRAAGFQMHIAKPVEPDVLVDAVFRLAGRS